MPDGFPQLLHHVVCPPEVWECSSLCVHQKRRSVPVSLVAVVQLLSHVQLFVTPWTSAHQASLSITNLPRFPELMSIKSVRPSNHLIPSSPSPPAFNLSQHQGLFQMSQFFKSGGQSIGASASASVLPMNIQDSFP